MVKMDCQCTRQQLVRRIPSSVVIAMESTWWCVQQNEPIIFSNCFRGQPHSPNYQASHNKPRPYPKKLFKLDLGTRRDELRRQREPASERERKGEGAPPYPLHPRPSMAFFTHWYDLLCLAMLAGAVLVSLWGILRGEDRSKSGDDEEADRAKYGGLLANGDGDERASSTVRSEQLWMSRWRALHPACLLALRLVAALTMVGVLLWDLRTYDWSIMLYYTEWTFSLVIIYFLIATCMSAHGCWIYAKHAKENDEANAFFKRDFGEDLHATLTGTNRNRKASKSHSFCEHDNKEQKFGFWGYLMQIAYQTSAGAVALTDIVFWGLLVPFLSVEHFKLDLLMGCMHSLNFVFLLLDTALNSLPFPWFRMAYFVLWSCIYVIFQWILHACGFSWWPYRFLQLSTPRAPLWYFCLALLHVPCYGVYSLLVTAKNTLFPKIFHTRP
ncbi:unnamed protein product [Musa hybrid cultivar]